MTIIPRAHGEVNTSLQACVLELMMKSNTYISFVIVAVPFIVNNPNHKISINFLSTVTQTHSNVVNVRIGRELVNFKIVHFLPD